MTRILAFVFAAIEVWHARHTRRYNTSHHGAVTTRTRPIAHNHLVYVPGCFRCDLSREEAKTVVE